MNDLLAGLRRFLDGLAPRERMALTGAGLAVGFTLVLLVVVQPTLSAREKAARRVAAAEQELAAMQGLRHELDEINQRLSRVEDQIKNGPQGNIFTLLESIARRTAVEVESMEPQASLESERYRETKVQVVLKHISLAQAVRYLDQVEKADQLLSVKSLRLRTRSDAPEFMDVTFTVSSFEPKT